MFPPFPQSEAKELIKAVLNGGSLLEEGQPQERAIEHFAIHKVATRQRSEAQGRNATYTIGALITTTGEKFIAISGYAYKIDCEPRESGEDKKKGLFGSIQIASDVVPAAEIESALRKNDARIHAISDAINKFFTKVYASGGGMLKNEFPTKTQDELKKERKRLCNESQKAVFDCYKIYCADGVQRKLLDITKWYCVPTYCISAKFPPSGTGDCAAIKLLNHVFSLGLTPKSMAEWNGKEFTGPCDSRCALIMPTMLGLNIIYRDDDIIVVNKPGGLLSVPGRVEKDCVVNRVKRLFPTCIEQPAVHRLDMETKGLLVLAFNQKSHSALNKQFAWHRVYKEYIALLDGVLAGGVGFKTKGIITLKHRVDINNRPHQIIDNVYGKVAITQYEILGVEKYKGKNVTRVKFIPLTGRTHQLRLAALYGLGANIMGDTLYRAQDISSDNVDGNVLTNDIAPDAFVAEQRVLVRKHDESTHKMIQNASHRYKSWRASEELCLTANKIRFQHPTKNEEMSFECAVGF